MPVPVLSLENITYSTKNYNATKNIILEDINLKLNEREITAILGRSGCGKSLLLRIASALVTNLDSGIVKFYDKELLEPSDEISIIFQNFTLFPWLNIFENIALAIENKTNNREIIHSKTMHIIDLIGLRGYEHAYPREISGGMKQRVAFARALVADPKLILMDQAFSALDVLTSQNLKTDFLDLWTGNELTLKSVLIVTHNIEEAVFLADKVIILSSAPGKVLAEVNIDLPHPRDRLDHKFREIVEEIYTIMTSRRRSNSLEAEHKLPTASLSNVENFLDTIEQHKAVSLMELSEELNMGVDDLFPIIDTMQLLRFAEIEEEKIRITASGKMFTNSPSDVRQKILGERLMQYVPVLGHIRRHISTNPETIFYRDDFLEEIKKNISDENAEKILPNLIDWGRSAKLFEYNDSNKVISKIK